MTGILTRLACNGNDHDTMAESETQSTPTNEARWAIESIIEEEVDWESEGDLLGLAVPKETFDQLRSLDVYNEDSHSKRAVRLLSRHDGHFQAHLTLVKDTAELKLNSVFYANDEVCTDCVTSFLRQFSDRSPHTTVDLEKDTPEMIVYTSMLL